MFDQLGEAGSAGQTEQLFLELESPTLIVNKLKKVIFMLSEINNDTKSLHKMPGPEEIKGKGHVEGDLAWFQLNAHKKYGRCFKFKLDADTVAVSTTDISDLKRCSKIFDKPEKLYSFLEPLMGKLMFLPLGENKSLRHLTISQFAPPLVQKKFGQLVQHLDAEIEDWLSEAEHTKGIIAIQEKTKALAMRLIVMLVCGQDFTDSAKLGTAIHTALEELLKLQYNPDSHQQGRLESSLKYINDTVKQFIESRRQLKDKKAAVFLDAVLQNYQDEVEIQNITKETLMAGYHTVASSIAWTLYALSTHPEVSQKLYHEIDSVFKDKPFSYEALSQLKYLDRVIKESSRRYTVGPYTAREADKDLVISGYCVPKGTTLFYPIWAVHMDPEYWPDPEKFDPERFKSSSPSSAFMSYGYGARKCPGMNIAQVLIKLVLARLLLKLTFQESPHFKPEICENFVLISKNDIQIRVSSRRKNCCPTINTRYLTYAAIPGALFLLAGAAAGGQGVILLSCIGMSTAGYFGFKKRNALAAAIYNFSITRNKIPLTGRENQKNKPASHFKNSK